MQAQRNVTDVTNELLMKNAKTLHQGSVNVAKESERGIVDMETLKQTNLELSPRLTKCARSRTTAVPAALRPRDELARIEGELKDAARNEGLIGCASVRRNIWIFSRSPLWR